MTKIKICGMMRTSDIDAVNEYLPDYCGFVLSRPFRRYVSREAAKHMKSLLDDRIKAVGVFVDTPPDEAASYVEDGIIDIIQLHGHEDEGYIRILRGLTDAPIFKAFQIKNEQDIKWAQQSTADMVMLDNGTGSGQTFDWTLIRDIGRPFALAGGLNEKNVADAIKRFSPEIVDISSGAETNGMKDPEKIKMIIGEVRNDKTRV
ncbi:MAG: phosphoribosylanthranilate isomerase [Lachnospiraceae bacterium]|nr:phosphoribosylanthranilate isomerase [Lachnospiraceae bacterium]